MRNGIQSLKWHTTLKQTHQLLNSSLPHTISEQISPAFLHNRRSDLIFPIIIMHKTAKRSLYPTQNDRYIRKNIFQNITISNGSIIRALTRSTVRRVGIITTLTLGSCVMIHHTIHTTSCHRKEKIRSSQFLKITQIIAPIGLGYYGYFQAFRFQNPGYNSGTKRRMINISIARKEDYIQLFPSQSFHLLSRSGQKCPLRLPQRGRAGTSLNIILFLSHFL